MPKLLFDPFRVPVTHNLALRVGEYLASDVYLSSCAQTNHWKKREEINRSAFQVEGDEIVVDIITSTGLSSFYPDCFPDLKKDYISQFKLDWRKARLARRQSESIPLDRVRIVKKEIRKYLLRALHCYRDEAYDALYYFNRNWPIGSGIISAEDIHKEYGKDGHGEAVKPSHIFNVLSKTVSSNLTRAERILEIGPGTGMTCRLLKKHYPNIRIVLVDLPESLPYSITALLYANPDASYLLPHEITQHLNICNYDFVFLLPNQIKSIPHHCVDFGVNTMSFQEMSKSDVKKYFELLRNVMRADNIFYCLNAVEKIMVINNEECPIRFFEYPWREADEDISYLLSPVHHHMTTKPFYEKICKLEINDDVS